MTSVTGTNLVRNREEAGGGRKGCKKQEEGALSLIFSAQIAPIPSSLVNLVAGCLFVY